MDNSGAVAHCNVTLKGKTVLSLRARAILTRNPRFAFTLVELIVVLAVMGVAIGVVAPAILPKQQNANELVASLILDARRAATHRAETVQLDVDVQGRWTIARNLSGAPSVLKRGQLASPAGSVRVLVSPLGICRVVRQATISLDALACAAPPGASE